MQTFFKIILTVLKNDGKVLEFYLTVNNCGTFPVNVGFSVHLSKDMNYPIEILSIAQGHLCGHLGYNLRYVGLKVRHGTEGR